MATKIDANAIRAVADNISKIMAEHKAAFEALKHHWPNAGKFPLAVWLERLVDDRRNGAVEHGDHLELAFVTISAELKAIADKFQNTDGENATAIKNVLSGLEKKVVWMISIYDQKTEEAQRNYSGKGTPSDGDGYNDNLSHGLPSGNNSTNATNNEKSN